MDDKYRAKDLTKARLYKRTVTPIHEPREEDERESSTVSTFLWKFLPFTIAVLLFIWLCVPPLQSVFSHAQPTPANSTAVLSCGNKVCEQGENGLTCKDCSLFQKTNQNIVIWIVGAIGAWYIFIPHVRSED